jgi:hypothetical protein
VTNDTEQSAATWLDAMLRAAYPETAGITLAAIEALVTQDTFTGKQTAYLMSVMFHLGAHARGAADAAELTAARDAHFLPRPTREARIALRTQAMAEQHEIAWLRRTGEQPPVWAGGTAEQAAERFGWDADRPDYVPPADVSVRVRRTREGLAWRDE